MTERFIRAKHWQLFLCISVPTLLLSSLIGGRALNRMIEDPSVTLGTIFFDYLRFIPLFLGITLSVFLGWLWAVGTRLQAILPNGLKMKMKTFRFFIFFPLFNAFVFAVVAISLAYNGDPGPYFFALLIPLNVISSAGVFYGTYFVAKTLKCVELGRMAKFPDFFITSFFIWLFFVGVWSLQPKIGRLLEKARLFSEGNEPETESEKLIERTA